MSPWLASLIDEVAAAAIGRFCLWRKRPESFPARPAVSSEPAWRGDLADFYRTDDRAIECHWTCPDAASDAVQFCDGYFASPVVTGVPENDRVHVRRWWPRNGAATAAVIGLGGLVQFGYYWFDRLGVALVERGAELWMMDEPYNYRRTPAGFRPGELIGGGGPEHLIASVRQAVIDTRSLIEHLRSRVERVGLVGQSFGGWLTLLATLLEPDLDFAIPLIPMCDLPAWYRASLPLARGTRLRFPHFADDELDDLLRPVNPIAWRPLIPGDRIDLHGARFDRLVVYESIEQLASAWGTRFTAHPEGHYSVFFGNRLRDLVVAFIAETVARAPRLELACPTNR